MVIGVENECIYANPAREDLRYAQVGRGSWDAQGYERYQRIL